MEDLKDIVSKNIIYLRTNNKMTQLELGRELSYSDKAVSKWERREAVPDAYVLLKLSSIFNVSVDYLLSEHSEKELKSVTRHRVDRHVISLISFLGLWTLAIFIFAIFWVLGATEYLIFVYTLPISLVLLIVFTAIWGKRRTNILYISLLVWSVLSAIYLTMLQYNWWLLFVVGIPAQVLVLLSFKVRKRPRKAGLSKT